LKRLIYEVQAKEKSIFFLNKGFKPLGAFLNIFPIIYFYSMRVSDGSDILFCNEMEKKI